MSNKHGMLLSTAVILIAAVAVIVTGVFFLTDRQMTTSLDHASGEEALYYAEAGINQYLWFLNEDPNFYITPEGISMTGTNIAFEGGFFRLAIDAPSESQPKVTIQSTGWTAADPSRQRTVETLASKRSFVQTVFLSDMELTTHNEKNYWFTGDIVNGPLHTNGTLNIWGSPIFNFPVTYSGSPVNNQYAILPAYNGGGPDYVTPLLFPPTNADLKKWAESDTYYGRNYVYSGQTSILLDGAYVWIRNGITPATRRNLPKNGVIFVEGSYTNKWGTWSSPSTAGNAFVSGTIDGRLTIAATNDIYITGRDPTNADFDNATVTGGVKYANPTVSGTNPTDDMLGLVANNYVRILHNGWFDSNPTTRDVAPFDIAIHAAVFATTWAFEYEDYSQGDQKGSINLVGSITQKYRGAEGMIYSSSFHTGYNNNYWHDPRMAYLSPPHFLEPLNAGWVLTGWREIANP